MLRASDRSAELPAQLGHAMLTQALRADLGVQLVGRNLPPKSHAGVPNPSRATAVLHDQARPQQTCIDVERPGDSQHRLVIQRLRISAHRGRRFRLMVDGISA
ncbi:hypothetical protein [Roseateles sp. LKC17W]|uniref:Uncharacterized protein n=1 Tax=Pelomonas margarita TaxID=3299031 RepID=A0ABW7FQI3_9BURK